MGLTIEALKGPGSGFVTPIEVERFENGVRVIFKPLGSSYASKNDEKKIQDKEETVFLNKKREPIRPPVVTGYLSPEQEAAEEERQEKEAARLLAEKAENAQKADQKSEPKKGPLKPEGGLEIIVESEPYRRVRVKRCNMGPQTIVKEESEAILMRAIVKGLQSLESDYRIALMTSFKP